MEKEFMNFGRENKGQVSVFVIIAVMIVVSGILVYLFYPNIKGFFGGSSENPNDFIQTCLEDEVTSSVNILSLQGGSIEPEHYFMYDNEKVGYLCYTNEYYNTCVMQEPMLKEHIEKEIKNEINDDVESCFNSLKENYKRKGYSVSLTQGDFNVELLPKRIVVNIGRSLTLEKGSSERYENFNVVMNNNLYELVSIANSILNWEARYGDAETTVYMNYYHDLKVEKKKQSDGTTVYILTDRNTRDKFQFASRSVAWPPGF